MPIDPETVERYQIEYQRNPKSRIFAPLAEAYRQMGLIEEAFQVCTKGVQEHPDFPGGRVALAKILLDQGEREPALTQLEKSIALSPDNILAHTLMGDLLLELRKPKEALKAFKTVLFLNPNDERAQRLVRRWEFLSAEDYDEELFEMRPVFQAVAPPEIKPLEEDDDDLDDAAVAAAQATAEGPSWRIKEIERAISLADAFIVRGEIERGLRVLTEAQEHLGTSPEIEKRLSLLLTRTPAEKSSADGESIEVEDARARKLRKLEIFLHRINERRWHEG